MHDVDEDVEGRETTGLIVNIIQEIWPDLDQYDHMDYRDVVQECELFVNKRKDNYDPSRGKWSTFVRQIAIGTIHTLKDKAVKYPSVVSPVDIESHMLPCASDIEELMLVDAAVKTYMALSERDKLIVQQLRHGAKHEEIAEGLGVNRSRVSQLIRDLRRKFRKALSSGVLPKKLVVAEGKRPNGRPPVAVAG